MNIHMSGWFDAHVHLRGPNIPWCPEAFELICRATARQCQYAVVMPNAPMIRTIEEMAVYRKQILDITYEDYPWFYPLMTGYLTPDTDVSNIAKAAQLPWFAGWKLYPQGVTTGSEAGVADISELKKVLSVIEHVNSNLLIHGEKIGADPLIAEEAFVKDELLAIRQMFAGKIVLEHCSTKAAIRAVFMDENMWGTLTPHHLTGHHSETDNPHNRCKPAWQPEDNQKDFLDTISCLAKIGQKKFFAGSDTAPQLESQKLSAEVPNGCFAAPVALQLYAQAFSHPPIANQETLRDLYNHLSAFLFENAADFYNVPKQDWAISPQTTNRDFAVIRDFPKHAVVKDTLDFYDPNREIRDRIIPLRHGERLEFSADFIHK